jgi:hypothetical protein
MYFVQATYWSSGLGLYYVATIHNNRGLTGRKRKTVQGIVIHPSSERRIKKKIVVWSVFCQDMYIIGFWGEQLCKYLTIARGIVQFLNRYIISLKKAIPNIHTQDRPKKKNCAKIVIHSHQHLNKFSSDFWDNQWCFLFFFFV